MKKLLLILGLILATHSIYASNDKDLRYRIHTFPVPKG